MSWYGLEVEGNDMGCPSYGPFRMNDPTIVAHKTLPCGTKVRLENPETGKVIVAVVKDRGPYVKGRTFDLSAAAAEKLDPDKDEKGLLFVHFTIIKIGDSQ